MFQSVQNMEKQILGTDVAFNIVSNLNMINYL